jgi:hypothetical protein
LPFFPNLKTASHKPYKCHKTGGLMAGRTRKVEVRVFLEPALVKFVDSKIGTLGTSRSQVIRTFVLDRYQQEVK